MGKIGIITAMPEEAEHIINLLSLQKTTSTQNITFFESDKYVLVLTGIGKIQASIGTSILCQNYAIKALINIGIAGNLQSNKAQIGQVFLIDSVFQHDMYLPFEGAHLNYAKQAISIPFASEITKTVGSNQTFRIGKCLTGDQFIDDQEKVELLAKTYQADVVEMEAFAIASVAREFGLLDKLLIIKAISDGADNAAKNAHEDNLDYAMKNSISALKDIIAIL